MSEPNQPHWSSITAAAAVMGVFAAPILLTCIATWYHERRFPGGAENWWELYTVPAGLFYGPTIAAGLVIWTQRLWQAERWPLGRAMAWYLFLPALLCLALFVLSGVIYLIGTTVSTGWGYAILFIGWVGLCLGISITRP
jgi:hypothetical protein